MTESIPDAPAFSEATGDLEDRKPFRRDKVL
jgi:hypothetical protein